MARRRRSLPPLYPRALAGARAAGPRPLAVLGLLCLSCTSGQIGGEVSVDPEDATLDAFGACEVVREEKISPATAELEFDLQALIEQVDGARASLVLAWGEEVPQGIVLTPEPAETTITLDLAYVTGSARRIEREASDFGAAEGAAGASSDAAAHDCSPLLAFDAQVTISTGNHALAGTFDIVFAARSPHLATAAFELDAGNFEGNLGLDVDADGDDELGGARIELAWADGQLSGSIGASAQAEGDTVSSGFEVGRFPASAADCLGGAPLSAASGLRDDAEDALQELGTLDLVWPDGDSTELSFEHEIHGACLQSYGDALAVTLSTTSRVESGDAGISGTWNLSATVGFDAHGEHLVTELARRGGTTFEAGTFATGSGISGIAVDAGVLATFALELRDEVSDGEPARGTLTVFEVEPAVCDLPPDAPTDGGGVAPGCAGDQLVEVGTAILTSID